MAYSINDTSIKDTIVDRRSLAVVYVTVFLDLLGFGIILPALPFYAINFGATGLWVGALLTAYSAAQFFSSPVLGRLSDRYGRRPIILASLAGSALSMLVTGLAHSLPMLLLGRSLAGIFGGSISAAQAYIADVTSPSERTRYMGMLGAAIGLGFVFGPAIGALMAPFGFNTAAFAAAGLAGLNLCLGYLLLREPYKKPGYPSRIPLSFRSVAGAFKNPGVARILLATFLVTFAFVSLEATFALYGQRRFALDARGLGLLFTAAGLLIALVQGGLVGRLNARIGERRVVLTGGALMALGFSVVPFMPSLISTLAVLSFVAVGQGLSVPALSSLLSLESATHEQGGVLGLGQSFSAAARATGPILAGALFDLAMPLPYWAAALAGILAAAMVGSAALAYETAKTSARQ